VWEPEQTRIEQRRLPFPLATHEPPRQDRESDGSDRDCQADVGASLLPNEDAENDPAHPDDREDRADNVDLSRPRVDHVADELDLREHDRDDDDLEQEADAP
jgi:hypothetical protein